MKTITAYQVYRNGYRKMIDETDDSSGELANEIAERWARWYLSVAETAGIDAHIERIDVGNSIGYFVADGNGIEQFVIEIEDHGIL